ncbi:hypothetical protein RJ639_022957 [Escallonia herrerae]|uniref:F-box domain-containing protein n=1 Tax=Escallonia herrerae TaxID=1293975 RepID=A0AA89ADN7_9ASTE|nr:hypothetical protein RJ639_022957 [Escallonia herrerae]
MDGAEPIEGIGSLPRDLIIDILSRLPVKVLCTFKAVSKQWRSLISSDPHFKKLHRSRSARVPKLLLSRYDYVFNLETVSFESNVHFLTIGAVDKTVYGKFDKRVADAGCVAITCCNLMCLVTYKAIHVSNPSTQEFVRLPDNRHRPYDPIMGFGYLASENVYKLVVLSVRGFFDDDLFDFGEENPDDAYDMGCEVLTIREGEPASGAWRDVGDLPCLAWKKNWVCVHGEIYWMALADSRGDLHKRIVVMSLGDEEFVTILFPRNVFAPPVNVMELVELKGHLCLVNHRKDVSTMEIWILKDRAKCLWNMECSIHLYPVDAHIQTQAHILKLIDKNTWKSHKLKVARHLKLLGVVRQHDQLPYERRSHRNPDEGDLAGIHGEIAEAVTDGRRRFVAESTRFCFDGVGEIVGQSRWNPRGSALIKIAGAILPESMARLPKQ